MHSLGTVQWNSTRRDHPGNPGGVSGSGLVRDPIHAKVYGPKPRVEATLPSPETHVKEKTPSLHVSRPTD